MTKSQIPMKPQGPISKGRRRIPIIGVWVFIFGHFAFAADPTIDWLMQQTTKPTTASTTQPIAVFKSDEENPSRPGVLKMNDGQTFTGQITTTAERPIRVWVESQKQYQDIPFELIKSIDATVVWERDEPEWKFKASGSDVKEYSGKTYPARETAYTFTLTDNQQIQGSVVAPLNIIIGETTKTFILHKRDKGKVGQKLTQLLYITAVRFSDATTQP